MLQIWAGIQVALATAGGVVGWYFGDSNSMLYALIAFTVLDFVLGLLRHALVEKNMASDRRIKRAVQKALIFALVGVANVVDEQVIGKGSVLRDSVIFFYLSGEGVSILEHAAVLGLPIPKKLRAILQELNRDDPERDTDVAGLLTPKQDEQKQQAPDASGESDEAKPKAPAKPKPEVTVKAKPKAPDKSKPEAPDNSERGEDK